MRTSQNRGGLDTIANMESFFPPAPRPYSAYAPIRAQPTRPRGRRFVSRDDRDDLPPTTPAAREIEIVRIARQLAQVAREVPWERVQNDTWDRACQFIFRVRTAARVRTKAEQIATQQGLEHPAFIHYALRRWYCFWGARVAELIFVGHPGVEAGPPKDHEVDFTIDGVPFDLKTSEVPRAFADRLGDLHTQPEQVATWLYAHQSRGRRFHAANRLYLLLCDADQPDDAWRLRGDVAALHAAIGGFLAKRRFVEIWVTDATANRRHVVTGVIPVLRSPGPRQLPLLFATDSLDPSSTLRVAADTVGDYQLSLPAS
jgi:hypothetical protein